MKMMEQDLEQQIISMPRIGDAAPEFKAVTTQGNINFPLDYKGKWAYCSVIRQILRRCALRSL